jgi:hypothetical protein
MAFLICNDNATAAEREKAAAMMGQVVFSFVQEVSRRAKTALSRVPTRHAPGAAGDDGKTECPSHPPAPPFLRPRNWVPLVGPKNRSAKRFLIVLET